MAKFIDCMKDLSISFKWFLAHAIKKSIVLIACFIVIPLVFFSVAFELAADLCNSIHRILEGLFSLIWDLQKPFATSIFKIMGFNYGTIELDPNSPHLLVYKIRGIAKNNGVKCYILGDIYRIDKKCYIDIVIPKKIDFNYLRLLFKSIPPDDTVF